MMDITPTSAAATMHALLSINTHRGTTPSKMAEPLDCSSPILDLCVRRRPRSPSPPNKNLYGKRPFIADEPTSSVGISVSSNSPGSETSETSTSSDLYRDLHIRAGQVPSKLKAPRPFKAYPKDPLSLVAGISSPELIMGTAESVESYNEFRKILLSQVQATHGITNKNMRRTTQGNNNNREDPNYWEKRRKNNEAAKRSRDARRAKEDEIAIRAAFLERENTKLRYDNAGLRNELQQLKSLLYSRPLV